MMRCITGMGLLTLAMLGGCNRADDEPRLPLGHPPVASDGTAGTGVAPITGEAKAALDSGNAAYKAKDYTAALAYYREAAGLVPTEEAPLFGMLMVASATKNVRLADSVTALMRAMNPQADSATTGDSAFVDIHSRVLPPSHPPLPGKAPSSQP